MLGSAFEHGYAAEEGSCAIDASAVGQVAKCEVIQLEYRSQSMRGVVLSYEVRPERPVREDAEPVTLRVAGVSRTCSTGARRYAVI